MRRKDAKQSPPSKAAEIFGKWLDQSLHEQFTEMMDDPLPQFLLDIVETSYAGRTVEKPHRQEPDWPAHQPGGRPRRR